MQIIYLNGPSSSGKTTLAKALQEAFEEPFLRLGIDAIIGWMPEKINDWTGGEAPLGYSWKQGRDKEGFPIQELQIGPYAQKIGKVFQEIVLTLARRGQYLIIDDVSFGKRQLDEWKEILKDFAVLWVGVNAPLTVLEQREKERKDRRVGSARGQFYTVHQDAIYDLEIDTYQESLCENIKKIKRKCQGVKSFFPYQTITRIGVYGVAKKGTKVLLITQEEGPYAGRLDFPGGGIEFGETISQTLHREFLEEVGIRINSMHLLENLTALLKVPASGDQVAYTFHRIGLIYSVSDFQVDSQQKGSLKHDWVDIESLQENSVTPFVWEIIRKGKR